MKTRDKILQASLELFANNGYDGVSVRQIAGAVGIRESALYKHFRNKEDILHKVIEETKERIHQSYVEYQVPETVDVDAVAGYQKITSKELCELSWRIFQLYTKDPVVSNFRKLLMREQFNNSDIAKQYNDFFLDGAVNHQSNLFIEFIKKSYFCEGDPKVMALQFYGPILLLFQRYDCEPTKEDSIKELLFQHVIAFGNHYGKH